VSAGPKNKRAGFRLRAFVPKAAATRRSDYISRYALNGRIFTACTIAAGALTVAIVIALLFVK
jgi:hypothetical protein